MAEREDGAVVLAFCEPVYATVRSREHIRVVGPEGLKYGGGIPVVALCGYDVRRGWDLRRSVIPANFAPDAEVNPTCRECIAAAIDLSTPPAQPLAASDREAGDQHV